MPNSIAFAKNYVSIIDEVYQRAGVSDVFNRSGSRAHTHAGGARGRCLHLRADRGPHRRDRGDREPLRRDERQSDVHELR